MKKYLTFLVILLASCSTQERIEDNTLPSSKTLYSARLENLGSKVYVDSDLKAHWNEGDEISIFSSSSNNKYKFNGRSGDVEGDFSLVGTYQSGENVPYVYAVYPYNAEINLTPDYDINLFLPAKQHYAENSYGIGANTMVAVTENNTSTVLNFKNICGYIAVQLYGDGIIKSITLTGNNNEKIAGQAIVAVTYGQTPDVMMSESAGTSIVLDCGEGVKLGKSVEDATAFWFAVPPVTFSQGFTVRVTNTDGYSLEKVSYAERTVVRSVENPLSPIEASAFPIIPDGNIEFEDANFKAYCIKNFDKNGDKEISYLEASTVTDIKCGKQGIHSLSGIQFFTSLKTLYCSDNQIASLEVHNKSLESLDCPSNLLSSIDVSGATNLISLTCPSNNISTIDISHNTNLKVLRCGKNSIEHLDLSNNPLLVELYCNNNDKLTQLDISHNPLLSELNCNNDKLTQLDISHNPNLGKLRCVNNELTSLDVSNNSSMWYLNCSSNKLTSLIMGSHSDVSLKIDCSSNNLSSLDVSEVSLETLNCSNNSIKEIKLPKYPYVSSINCSHNLLSNLSIPSNSTFMDVNCSHNNLTLFDCDASLLTLDCSHNQLQSINTRKWYHLSVFRCNNNLLESIDLRANTELKKLNCDSNFLQELNVSRNTVLDSLSCNHNALHSLDIQANPNLTILSCNNNELQSLSVQNYSLTQLDCSNNKLTSLNVGANAALMGLDCYANNLTSLDVSSNLSLSRLHCNANPYLSEIWLQYGQSIADLEYDSSIATIKYKNLDFCHFEDANFEAFCIKNFDSNGDGKVSLAEASAVTSISVNTDNIQSLSGVEYFTELEKLSCDGISKGLLSSLDISHNTKLIELSCTLNQISHLDVTHNTKLQTLTCRYNLLSSLDVSNNTALSTLDCNGGYITQLDVSNNHQLTKLICSYNPISSLIIGDNSSLKHLYCQFVNLSKIDLHGYSGLASLYCDSCYSLTEIDVRNCTSLKVLQCYGSSYLSSIKLDNCDNLVSLNCERTATTTLDLSTSKALQQLVCGMCQLSGLDVSNNLALKKLYCYSNPYLTEIWLKTGQTISDFQYDTNVATIKYKD